MLKLNFIIVFSIFAFADCYSQTDSSKNADSLLLLQIQGQMGQQQTPPPQQRVSASANPDISVIGDFGGYIEVTAIIILMPYCMRRNFHFSQS